VVGAPEARLSTLSLIPEEEMGSLKLANFPDAELSQRDLENLFKQITNEG